jgi:hypothetical protein
VVGFKTVRRSHGYAVAISYTLGEFDRRKVVIGYDDQKEPIKTCLGVERNTKDFEISMARIFREHSRRKGVWIDQLCIPQDDPVEQK